MVPNAQKAIIGLGSSLGNRRFWLDWAVRKFALHPDIQFIRSSRAYRTPPMNGGKAKGWFLNGVVMFECTMEPNDLLALCRRLEDDASRRRGTFWGDRTLDLDILLYGNLQLNTPTLKIPHPALLTRPFVTMPLIEIGPNLTDPRSGKLIKQCAAPIGPRPVPIGIVAAPPKGL
jgi:2-amino-4-hydroxy-6-hydroxymethyldihydropteridine diphosphokinase